MRRWRVGRKLGRTVYFDDAVVGIVDTREMAKGLVRCANDHDALMRVVAVARYILNTRSDVEREQGAWAELDRALAAVDQLLREDE
jgi:hypothetical protein